MVSVKQREVIRKAFDLYGLRGTVAGLREALEFLPVFAQLS